MNRTRGIIAVACTLILLTTGTGGVPGSHQNPKADAVSSPSSIDSPPNVVWRWANPGGGVIDDGFYKIAIDTNNNSYVTGMFQGSATFGNISLASKGAEDVVIAKMNVAGACEWAVMAGGTGEDEGDGIAVDSYGNSYIVGTFAGAASFGGFQLISHGSYDVFIAKLNNKGNWQWAISAGGTSEDSGRSIAVDGAGNAYITGGFHGSATFGSTILTTLIDSEVYVAKISADGQWQWAVAGNGTSDDEGVGIAVDSTAVYVLGSFNGSMTLGNTTLTGTYDVFVARLNTSGGWQWASSGGGASVDSPFGISLDAAGHAFIVGSFELTALFETTNITSLGGDDAFVAKIASNGSWLWAVSAGGVGPNDQAMSVVVDSSGNAVVSGQFQDAISFGGILLTSAGLSDVFVAKLSSGGSWRWASRAGGNAFDEGFGVAVEANDWIHVAGLFSTVAVFGNITLTSRGGYDAFVAVVYELVDTTPPVTSIALNGTLVTGEYTTNVTVTLTAIDDMSGVNCTMAKVDDGTYQLYHSPFNVSGFGNHTVSYFSVDYAGNVETAKSKSFKIRYPLSITIKNRPSFGVVATIVNDGEVAMEAQWNISVKGDLLFMGMYRNGSRMIPAGKWYTARDFIVGLGSITITVRTNEVTVTATAFALAIFVVGVKQS